MMIMNPYKSQSYTHNKHYLYFWESVDEIDTHYYSNYWIKVPNGKNGSGIHEGYKPYISIYYGDTKKQIYVKIYGRQAKCFQDMEKAIFYIQKQFDVSIMDEYEYEIFTK